MWKEQYVDGKGTWLQGVEIEIANIPHSLTLQCWFGWQDGAKDRF